MNETETIVEWNHSKGNKMSPERLVDLAIGLTERSEINSVSAVNFLTYAAMIAHFDHIKKLTTLRMMIEKVHGRSYKNPYRFEIAATFNSGGKLFHLKLTQYANVRELWIHTYIHSVNKRLKKSARDYAEGSSTVTRILRIFKGLMDATYKSEGREIRPIHRIRRPALLRT